MRLPTTFDASGRVQQRAAEPFRRERITEDKVQDPKRLADALTKLGVDLDQVMRTLGMQPAPDTYQGLVFGTAAAKTRIAHGFGRVVKWRIARWYGGATAGHSLVEATNDGTSLVLASYVAGTGDLEVY